LTLQYIVGYLWYALAFMNEEYGVAV